MISLHVAPQHMTRGWMVGGLLLLALHGCASNLAADSEEGEVQASEQALVFIPNTPRMSVSEPVGICYYMGSTHPQYVNWIQAALDTTWGARSALEFAPASCESGVVPPNTIVISLVTYTVDPETFQVTPITNEDGIAGSCGPWTRQCVISVCDPSVPSPNCANVKELLQYTAVHEVGHALGFMHEHQRPDTFCPPTPENENDDQFRITQGWELTAFDQDSIMSYCLDRNDNGYADRVTYADYVQPSVNIAILSAGDIDGVQAAYGFDSTFSIGQMCEPGDEVFLEDIDADGVSDFLCRGATKVYGTINGSQTGIWTEFTRNTAFCHGAGETLRVSDFNGDKRADLMCRSSSEVRVDYASTNAASPYGGAEWSMGGWCMEGTGAALYLGDFNQDYRTDVLCMDWTNDHWFIDYADASGHFNGGFGDALAPFNASASCLIANQNPANIIIADLNGDRRDDVICDGFTQWYIFTTNGANQIGTATSRIKSAWVDPLALTCGFGSIQVGRLDGDGRDDLLCRRTVSSSYASISVQFGKAMLSTNLGEGDWTGPVGGFCAASTSKLRPLKYDNNARQDFACVNADGTITIALIPSTFGAPATGG